MPWMYWSAIRTRLLVGIFTPAIRSTKFSPVANPSRTGRVSAVFGRASANADTTPFPLRWWGPASFRNYPTWIRGLLRIQLGFVNRPYALARFFVTFLALLLAPFLTLAAPRALELAAAFRAGRFEPLAAVFPVFRAAALEGFPRPLDTVLDAFPFARPAPLAARLAAPAF